MADTDTMESAPDVKRALSLTEKIVIAVCVIGVLVAAGLAFASADLPLLNSEMFDVVSATWNSDATVGVFVALGIAASIAGFVFILSKATIASKGADGEAE